MKIPMFPRLPSREAPSDEQVDIRYRSTAPLPPTTDLVVFERPFPDTIAILLNTGTITTIVLFCLVCGLWGWIVCVAIQALS